VAPLISILKQCVRGAVRRTFTNESTCKYESQRHNGTRYDLKHVLEKQLCGWEPDDVERPYLMGEVAATIRDIKSAKEIIDEMVTEAIQQLRIGCSLIEGAARL
jgi:hypothetical protein